MKFETPNQARKYVDAICGTREEESLGSAQIKIATKIYEMELRINALYDELGKRAPK